MESIIFTSTIVELGMVRMFQVCVKIFQLEILPVKIACSPLLANHETSLLKLFFLKLREFCVKFLMT